MALAALQKVRQQVPGGPDVAHHVDAVHEVPDLVGRFRPLALRDARIRAKQVDAAFLRQHVLDDGLHALLTADVGGDETRTDLLRLLRPDFGIAVRGDDSGAFLHEAGGERETDTRSAAGHDDDFVLKFHGDSVVRGGARRTFLRPGAPGSCWFSGGDWLSAC